VAPTHITPPQRAPDCATGGSTRPSQTPLSRAGLRDRRPPRLAEIVHEADLRDGKFPRDEARGIDLVIRGLLAANADDHQVLEHGLALFEGLYTGASRKA